MVSHFRPQSNVTRTQWAAYLEDLYRQIFSHLYADSRVISPVQRLSGLVEAEQSAGELGIIFSDFTQRFFDPNGFFTGSDPQVAAQELASLYCRLIQAESFPYGHSLVTRVFFTLMGEMRGFREKLGGIDFRRLNSEEVEWLRDKNLSQEKLGAAFLSALSHHRDPIYPGQLTHYPFWPDHSISLEGLRFLEIPAGSDKAIMWSKEAGNEALIVLINGRLVKRSRFEHLLHEYQKKGGLIGEWRIDRAEWVGELAGLDKRYATQKVIDCSDVENAASPVCLSLHPFTHLSYPQHQRLEHFLQNEHRRSVMNLEDKPWADKVIAAIEDARAAAMLKLAALRIQRIAASLHKSIEAELKAKPQAEAWPGQPPQFVMTMGGSGSGKNSSRYFNKHYREENRQIKDQFIYASLDDGRPHSDIYPILIAAGQHADDYEAVHLWADTRRNWLCAAARKRRMNVIFDGSGIEYSGRYDRVVADFADAGYRTKVVAADCMLLVPEIRRGDYPLSAIDRIMRRAGYLPDGSALPKKKRGYYRTLPWRIAINKHIGFPASLLAAFADPKLDRLVLIDNARGAGTDCVMAEKFCIEDKILKSLEQAEKDGRLVSMLAQHHLLPEGREEADILEKNAGFMVQRVQGKNHLLVIADMERMVDIIEKGQLNPNAHGPQALAWLKRTASFLIDRIDKPHGVPTIPPKKESARKSADGPRSNYLRLNSGKV